LYLNRDEVEESLCDEMCALAARTGITFDGWETVVGLPGEKGETEEQIKE